MPTFTEQHLAEASRIIDLLDQSEIEAMALGLSDIARNGGRVFFIGVGGSAGNCSHAVNDFRKICGIESYCPTDNVSELTARTNDEGWSTVFSEWLITSRLSAKDCLFVMSVGGGSLDKNISPNIVHAINHAKHVGAAIYGIVGRDGGHTKNLANTAVVIPTVNEKSVTPHTEAFQAVVWHLLVSHPLLQKKTTKWESAT